MQGTIESLRTERGFGFIRDVQGGEVFFHHTALPSPDYFADLTIGMVVEFEAEPEPQGAPCHQGRAHARALLIMQNPRGHRPGICVGPTGPVAVTFVGSTHYPQEAV